MTRQGLDQDKQDFQLHSFCPLSCQYSINARASQLQTTEEEKQQQLPSPFYIEFDKIRIIICTFNPQIQYDGDGDYLFKTAFLCG